MKPILTGLAVFLVIALLTQLLAYQRYQLIRDAQKQRVQRELNIIKDKFQGMLGNSRSATQTLAFIVNKYGVAENFDSIAAGILASNNFIDALQLTEKGVITHVFPLTGNESVIGFNVFQDSLRSVEAFKAVEKKTLFFAGPFELFQGGTAVIGRLPMYRENEFTGFSAALIRLPTLLNACGMDEANDEFVYQLSKKNPVTGVNKFFLPDPIPDNIFQSVEVPEGEWELHVGLRQNSTWLPGIAIFSVLGLMLAVTGGLFAWNLVWQPEKLNRLVRIKTSEIGKQKQNTITTLERVSDAFVALDNNWCYTYMNKKAGELFQRNPEQMIGKHIWTEFPEGVGRPFYHAYNKALAEQKYIHLEEYYEPYDLWFENHIYPSPNGLSIYFRDITENKKAAQKLEASEKYFRTLIEKSTDAIALLDRNGKILFLSPSAERITGFLPDEMLSKNIQDFISESNLAQHDKAFRQMLTHKGNHYTVVFQHRHKAKYDIWLEGTYTNLLEESNIRAIVFNFHDVTSRIESEEKIKAANRLYHFTSRINQMMIHVSDEETLYQEVCTIAVDVGKFKMAWIGKPDNGSGKVRPVALAGEELGYLQKVQEIQNTQGIAPEGPLENAIKNGNYFYCNDIENDPVMKPYAAEAIARGFRASIALPVVRFGRVVALLNIFSIEAFCFDENEIALLQEACRNISFTLENFAREELRKKAEQQTENEKLLSDSIINSLPGVFYLYDKKGNFMRWNKNFEIVTGYSREEIRKAVPLVFFSKDEQPFIAEKIQEVFDTGHAEVTANFCSREGKLIPYYFNGRRVTFNNMDYLIGMGIDISQRVHAELALKDRTEEIQKLMGYLQNVREEERTHIAREIHDVLGQQLTALKMDSFWLRKIVSDEKVQERLSAMVKLIDETIRTVRKISSELRPGVLDDLGLVAALEWQTSEFERNTGIQALFTCHVQEVVLDQKLATNIFRIFQETLTNVARHSMASVVTSVLEVSDHALILIIKDNGKGIDLEEVKKKKSLGLLGMQERANLFGGTITIKNNIPSGTVISLEVPLQKNVTIPL